MLADELGVDMKRMATVQLGKPLEFFTFKQPKEKKRQRRKLKPRSKKKRFDSIDWRIEMGQVERQSECIYNQNRDIGKDAANAEYFNTNRDVSPEFEE